MVASVITPKQPKGNGWQKGPATDPSVTMGYEGRYWFYPDQGFTVISAVEVANDLMISVQKSMNFVTDAH